MGKYDDVRARTGWGVPSAADRSRSAAEIQELLDLTRDADPRVRTVAVTNLCPCHVRADFAEAWDRILEMTTDPEPKVRRAVVHMLADGSPRHRADGVVAALDSLRNDKDRVVRKQVNRVLASYRRTGRINVL